MNSKYKLLILDYGGVYSFSYSSKNFNPFNHIMLKSFGKVPSEEEYLEISEKSHLLGENKLTTEEYIRQVANILKVTSLPSVKQFEDATIEVTNPPSPEMVELVRNVRQSGIKASLLSDMYMFEVNLTKPWGRYDGFDYVSLSAEAGMTKRDPRIFTRTLDYFQISAHDALFVDDKLENVEVAKKTGLSTIFADKNKYKNAESLAEDILQGLSLR